MHNWQKPALTRTPANIADKPELNRAWDEWVDRDNLPLRACLGVDLEGDDLVELVVTAAVDGP